ncbi:DNA primase DnaG [Methanocaldococcus infernus]|uniref:DNA primase DnaG n=1 Tax=Methanocaldococcus infernus (strain DSM 11812 / JCM 15783 / ME) TaxID=573063 RepID=D5VS92_METIM|nr:DNA primase DnaG [Methanocaldococcus infernus]ADG13445.1 TOPRIM domain protein [Methanocaldococcus infernus ME]
MDLGTAKYIIHAELIADGYIEKNDIIGAIFGQTEGLLGDELDLRELQKSGRIGRIDVELTNINGKSIAKISIPSSLDRVETSLIAAALETVDKVGPCNAKIKIIDIEDIRKRKRKYIVERAKEILSEMMEDIDINAIIEEIRNSVRAKEIVEYGEDKLPAGPNVDKDEEIIIVEGKADVLNLLKYGIKNAIAVNGSSVPKTIIDLCKKKIVTVFTDGDRGGELILKELLQTCDIDYVARAPNGREVEELTKKEIIKCLRNRIPSYHYIIKEEVKEPKKINKFSNYYEKYLKLNEGELLVIGDEEKLMKLEEYLKEPCEAEALIVKGDITQSLVDASYDKVKFIFGKSIKVAKKPLNLSLIPFGGLDEQR